MASCIPKAFSRPEEGRRAMRRSSPEVSGSRASRAARRSRSTTTRRSSGSATKWSDGARASRSMGAREVFAGAIRTIEPDFDREVELQNLLAWADEVRSLQVWANADYPRDAARARKFGAQGIGLDRTEHMFMETDRLPIVHEMILAAPEYRKVKRQREALAKQLETATNDRRRDLEARLAEVDSRLEDLSRRYVGSLEHLGRMQRDDFVGIL